MLKEQDESVTDPLLAEHLAFFGIDFSSLQKDLLILETVFIINQLCRYYKNQNLKMAFDNAPADLTVDLNMQLTKLANDLLSGKYSVPAVQNDNVDSSPTDKQEGIRPRMFKAVIAASHPEFSTMRQQDALEFFLHLIEQVERIHSGNPNLDPSRSFFYILSLNIPLDKATNKNDVVFKAWKDCCPSGMADRRFLLKLKEVKRVLKNWRSDSKSKENSEQLRLLDNINALEIMAESRQLTDLQERESRKLW
ncbi:hypothetical protein L2E82_14850 [Cichorium intybus]|uniref:Uncharacterized protein n=1 Tax=Cichorium intybus TaxID=13427 RepID=A0ACB9F1R8_CICIN|nr:hypothetical protein L2E82_14850 [Cichorium intybus]